MFEGKTSDLLRKNPKLSFFFLNGIENPVYLNWLNNKTNTAASSKTIKTIKTFLSLKQKLKQKGLSTDINSYSSIKDLENVLLKMKEPDDPTFIGKFGEWLVYRPDSFASSCKLGKNTKWCTTTITKDARNHFEEMTLEDGITLFYLLRKNGNPRKNPEDKIAISVFWDDTVMYDKGRTVDAVNNNLSKEKLIDILGSQYSPIISSILGRSKQESSTKYDLADQAQFASSTKEILEIIKQIKVARFGEQKIQFIVVQLIKNFHITSALIRKLYSIYKRMDNPHDHTFVYMAMVENDKTPIDIIQELAKINFVSYPYAKLAFSRWGIKYE